MKNDKKNIITIKNILEPVGNCKELYYRQTLYYRELRLNKMQNFIKIVTDLEI